MKDQSDRNEECFGSNCKIDPDMERKTKRYPLSFWRLFFAAGFASGSDFSAFADSGVAGE